MGLIFGEDRVSNGYFGTAGGYVIILGTFMANDFGAPMCNDAAHQRSFDDRQDKRRTASV